MAITFNPMQTSNAGGLFYPYSDGYIQGQYQFDPVSRQYLAGGFVAATVTQPVWGGMAISEFIPSATGTRALGGAVTLASSVANITGFTVSTQMHNAIVTQGVGNVPVVSAGQSVQFARFGSGVRLIVGCDPSLVDIDGDIITTQVSWDFGNQVLQPYDASTGSVSITSMTATLSGSIYTIAVVASAATNVGAVGDYINISGATNAGTAGNAAVNGNFVVTSFTDNEHFSFQVSNVGGSITTIAGTPVLNQGVGALPVKILGIQQGNSKVVVYQNGIATWNNSGTAAEILL